MRRQFTPPQVIHPERPTTRSARDTAGTLRSHPLQRHPRRLVGWVWVAGQGWFAHASLSHRCHPNHRTHVRRTTSRGSAAGCFIRPVHWSLPIALPTTASSSGGRSAAGSCAGCFIRPVHWSLPIAIPTTASSPGGRSAIGSCAGCFIRPVCRPSPACTTRSHLARRTHVRRTTSRGSAAGCFIHPVSGADPLAALPSPPKAPPSPTTDHPLYGDPSD